VTPGAPKVFESEYRPGQVFAERYRIVQFLGSGGTADVYKAQDSTAREFIALKFVHLATAPNARTLAEFRRDINAFAKVSHKNVVRVLGLGQHLGRPYVSMEFVEGPTLAKHLEEARRVSGAAFFRIFEQLCGALVRVHAEGVIHREISLQNIMISDDGAIKLMDFGVSRDLRQATIGNPTGPLECEAPEQLMGRPLSFATDIYSAGAVAYELLTGKRPHAKSRVIDRCTARPPSLSAELPDISPALAAMIEKCLEPNASARFQSAEELRAAFSQIPKPLEKPGVTRLASLIRDDPADPDQMVPLLLKIVRRLGEMHEAGTSHRELSPANIGLSADGIEIESQPAAPAHATLLIADPKYAPPELFLAQTIPDSSGHVAGDVYVLGFAFYELLAGHREFDRQFAELAQGKTGLGWMSWHADPSQRVRPLAEVAPECPKPLAELIDRMIEKDPARRVRVLGEIEQVLDQLRARVESTQQFAIKPEEPVKGKRPRTGVRIAVAALFTLALLTAAWFAASVRWRDTPLPGYVEWLRSRFSKAAPPEPAPLSKPAGRPPMVRTATGPMMLVPEGEFVMGDDSVPEEAPAHTVRLPAFYIDRFEVTNGAYKAFCLDTGRSIPAAPAWDPEYLSKGNYPAAGVKWDDANAFCQYAGKRLPSEAEWEKAARGTEDPGVVWGNWKLPGLANLKGAGPGTPAAGGSFSADISPFSVMDMAGNLQEWVADEYRVYDGNTGALSRPPAGSKVVRGGSFASFPAHLSPGWRGWSPPEPDAAQRASLGFRCAADETAALRRATE
jgi:serine/threonine-protein kinase